MADLSDVEAALVAVVGDALYSGGVPPGPAPVSRVVGAPVRVRRGWMNPEALNADLKDGIVNVTVSPRPGTGRETTRFPRTWQPLPSVPPTLTVVATASSAAFSGVGGAGYLAGVRHGGMHHIHALADGEDAASVATALAAMIPGASASDGTLAVPAVGDFAARVSAPRRMIRELRRQEHHLQVVTWAPTPALRDTAAVRIDAALAELDFLPLVDGSAGRIRYGGSTPVESASKAASWRRDLFYRVEYPTTETRTFPTVLFGVVAAS